MKLKTVKLPDGSGGPTIVVVKSPKLWIGEVSVGEIFDVQDEIGHALMAKHPGMFAATVAASEPKPQAADIAQVKMTRKVVQAAAKHA